MVNNSLNDGLNEIIKWKFLISTSKGETINLDIPSDASELLVRVCYKNGKRWIGAIICVPVCELSLLADGETFYLGGGARIDANAGIGVTIEISKKTFATLYLRDNGVDRLSMAVTNIYWK